MKITKTWSEDECIANIDPFLKKFDAGTLEMEDTPLFFSALFGAIYKSRAEKDDEEKQELWENIADDIEELGTMAYFVVMREKPHLKYIWKVVAEDFKMMEYEGEYEGLPDVKSNIWMDWIDAVQKDLFSGNPNMSAAFFAGDVKVIGSTKMGAKPRDWVYDFFAFLDREPKA